MSWKDRIVLDPAILVGKPVVKGTRLAVQLGPFRPTLPSPCLAVEFIIDLLAQGWREEDILRNYPGLTREDIQACLSYASALLRAEKIYPFELKMTTKA